jgi:hypothetical protein
MTADQERSGKLGIFTAEARRKADLACNPLIYGNLYKGRHFRDYPESRGSKAGNRGKPKGKWPIADD